MYNVVVLFVGKMKVGWLEYLHTTYLSMYVRVPSYRMYLLAIDAPEPINYVGIRNGVGAWRLKLTHVPMGAKSFHPPKEQIDTTINADRKKWARGRHRGELGAGRIIHTIPTLIM